MPMELMIVDVDELPVHEVAAGDRVRVIAAESNGAKHMAVVERWLDPGVASPLHRHPAGIEEVVWVMAGCAEFTVGDETATVPAEHTVVIPPLAPHTFRSVGDEPLQLMCRYSAARPLVLDEDGNPAGPEVPGT